MSSAVGWRMAARPWVPAGDRVASLMPNCPALVVHYLACFKADGRDAPELPVSGPEIDHALAVSGPARRDRSARALRAASAVAIRFVLTVRFGPRPAEVGGLAAAPIPTPAGQPLW